MALLGVAVHCCHQKVHMLYIFILKKQENREILLESVPLREKIYQCVKPPQNPFCD